jgi:hypothetical protein
MRPAIAVLAPLILIASIGCASWTTRDKRWIPRGEWNWQVRDRLPDLFIEFNGIDFGHAHLAETLLRTREPAEVEKARLEILDFIFSAPEIAPDEIGRAHV